MRRSFKINYLQHTIESHITWDQEHPMPQWPGGRHAQEIAELRNALLNCKQIHNTKCTGQPQWYPVPVPVVTAEGAEAIEAAEAAETVEAVEMIEAVEVGVEAAEGLELLELVPLLLLL